MYGCEQSGIYEYYAAFPYSTQGLKLLILNFNLTFPALRCAVIQLSAGAPPPRAMSKHHFRMFSTSIVNLKFKLAHRLLLPTNRVM